MATVPDLWNGLAASLETATQGLPPPPVVMVDWPNPEFFSDIARDGGQAIVVFDLNMSKPSTRWVGGNGMNQLLYQCATATTLSNYPLSPAQQQTITIGASAISPTPTVPAPGDAVSFVVSDGPKTFGVVAIAIPTDTYNSLAARLASKINASSIVNPYASATATNNIVTVTGIKSSSIDSFAGNNGTQILELAREVRPIQIACFAATTAQRDQLSTVVKVQLATLQKFFGLVFADGTAARVLLGPDKFFRDYHNSNLWRYDCYINCEIGITTIDVLYSVLVPGFSLTPNT